MERADVRLEHGLLPHLHHVLVDLGLGLVVGLLDPGRMDAPVLQQLLEREPGDLAAHAVEAREQHRAWVSSMMKSIPVSVSSARMLRPSRPMMRPFSSSDLSSTTDTVVSTAWLEATRCITAERMLRARRSASWRVSSSTWRISRALSWRSSSSSSCMRICLA